MKTAEFGLPASHLPEPGRCRICGWQKEDRFDIAKAGGLAHDWADETRTICDRAACIAEAKREIGR